MAEPVNVTKLPAPARVPVAVDVNNPISLYLDTGVFEQLQRVAKLMVSSGLAPDHLKGESKMADAFLVTAQAFRWGMDPFAVAQHTFVYQKKLGYEGKLIAAVVNSRGRLKSPLNYRYEGTGDNRKVIVSGTIEGETAPREIEGTAKEWRTNNEKWRTMTDQMLAYRGAREWGRRHAPELILGVHYGDDEIPQPHIGPDRAVDITPAPTPRDLDAALAAETEQPESGQPGEPPAPATPEGEREGPDSAATAEVPLDARGAVKMIATLPADALELWERVNAGRIAALPKTAQAMIRAAINDRQTELRGMGQ
ncbi:MAG: hypothetical protein INF12_14825 [Methylobacterium sp.]|nr:hypothetical protein [Methylobacterium sp.]